MSDDVDKPDSSDDESQGPRGGERLAQARREQQIAVIEIAKELHLDEHKVRSLERNEFDVLGAPVFAKGYLRKYAQLVNVKAEDVLADYYRMNRSVEAPPVILARPRPRQELSPGPWIAVIVVIIIAVTAYLWFTRPDAPAVMPPPAEDPAQELAVDESPLDAQPAPGVDAEPVIESEPEPDSEVAPEPEPEPQDARPPVEETSSPAIAEWQVRILLTYTGDCWTEITDATGRRLFFNLGRDGRIVELSGAEPLSVLFGNPGNVEVAVNGSAFALPETARPDRPMRLTISGP